MFVSLQNSDVETYSPMWQYLEVGPLGDNWFHSMYLPWNQPGHKERPLTGISAESPN